MDLYGFTNRQEGCSIGELQEAKKRAYIANGGVILNPDALYDLYEALKAVLREYNADPNDDKFYKACYEARKALAKADMPN